MNQTRVYQYESVQGFFKQDDPLTNESTFDFTLDFGLIGAADVSGEASKAQTPWQQFADRVKTLNQTAALGECYKVLFLGRHGQGEHNVAEDLYGTKAWDDHWSKLDSADGIVFLDAHLTDKGRQQARTAHDTWQRNIALGLPAPESYYCSPLDRCLETCRITFGRLQLPAGRPFVPKVKELLREVIGEHTCDKRSTKSYIIGQYPEFRIEDNFSEEDPLWRADHRETDDEQHARLKNYLDDVFASDRTTFISMTAHSGAIRSMLHVLGHREFGLQTGAVIPMVVKATRLEGRKTS